MRAWMSIEVRDHLKKEKRWTWVSTNAFTVDAAMVKELRKCSTHLPINATDGTRKALSEYISIPGVLDVPTATVVSHVLHHEGSQNQVFLGVLNMVRTIMLSPGHEARIVYWLEDGNEKTEGAGRGRTGPSERTDGGHPATKDGRSRTKVARSGVARY